MMTENLYHGNQAPSLTDITPGYDGSIASLLDQCEADWGDPEINRKSLVPYGILPLDKALYGIDTTNGELILVIGKEKQRKTTFVMNVVCNVLTAKNLTNKPVTVIDSLESGMRPKKYRDALISIMATRHLMAEGHVCRPYCPVCKAPVCVEMEITPKFLKYNTRTAVQQHAIQHAMRVMSEWPLFIYGANPRQGNTRNLQESIKSKQSRWRKLVQQAGAKLFVIDHVQQFEFSEDTTDYEKQLRGVSAVSDVVAQENIACIMLSQVSLGSLKGGGKMGAAGGSKAAQEANVVFSTAYEQNSGVVKITIEEAREVGAFHVLQPLEEESGTFYGTPTTGFITVKEEKQGQLV